MVSGSIIIITIGSITANSRRITSNISPILCHCNRTSLFLPISLLLCLGIIPLDGEVENVLIHGSAEHPLSCLSSRGFSLPLPPSPFPFVRSHTHEIESKPVRIRAPRSRTRLLCLTSAATGSSLFYSVVLYATAESLISPPLCPWIITTIPAGDLPPRLDSTPETGAGANRVFCLVLRRGVGSPASFRPATYVSAR